MNADKKDDEKRFFAAVHIHPPGRIAHSRDDVKLGTQELKRFQTSSFESCDRPRRAAKGIRGLQAAARAVAWTLTSDAPTHRFLAVGQPIRAFPWTNR
jgi:hypothetical protein